MRKILWVFYYICMMIRVLEINLFHLKEKYSILQNTSDKKWKLSNDIFWPRSNIRKYCLNKTIQIGHFAQHPHIIFVSKIWERLEILKRWNYWSLKEIETSYEQKFVHTDNHGQKVCYKVKKIKETSTAT